MPGVDLNLDLPSLSDSMSDIVAALVVAISTIEDDLSAKVVPAELDINAALSMGGNSLTAVGSVQLMSGNAPTAAGSLYYHTDGEFYMLTSAGAVKVTANGSLNVTAANGIVGDYGLGPEAVSYDNLSGEYRFTEDTGVWADLVADDLVLNSASGSVRFAVDNAITTARQFILKDIPASGVSALVYNASNSTVESAENQRITNQLKATILDISGNFRHAEVDYAQGFHDAKATVGSISFGAPSGVELCNMAVGATMVVPITAPMQCGVSRLKKLVITHDDNSNPTWTVRSQGGLPCVVGSVGVTAVVSSATSGQRTTTLTVNTPTTLGAGCRHTLEIHNNAVTTMNFYQIVATVDAVA